MDEVWQGDFLTLVALMAEKEFIVSEEGMFTLDQMVKMWDIAKMEIMCLDLVTEMIMAEVEVSLQ